MTRAIRNEHYGQVVKVMLGGVDLELITLAFDDDESPIAHLIDLTGTLYSINERMIHPTGKKKTREEIERILAAAKQRWQKVKAAA